MNLRRLIPFRLRMLISRKYADIMLEEAIRKADNAYKNDGHRYYVLPTVKGDLKVTNVDCETRDRRRDKRLLKKSVRKPYQLRRESFYFTRSDKAKAKFIKDGTQDWELKAMRQQYYRWYFKNH